MSYNLKEPSSQDFEHPPPLALVQDEGDRMGSPIIPNMENSEADIIPIIPSPGYQPDIFGAPLVGSNSGQNHGHGSREGESEGNSLGVQYQSTNGSVLTDKKYSSGNDLGSRLNSPLITGQTMDPSSIQMDLPYLDMGLQPSTPFTTTRPLQPSSRALPLDMSTQRLSGFNTPLFDTIGLSLSSSKQSHLSKDTVLGSLLQPADTYSPFLARASSTLPSQSPGEKRRQRALSNQIPGYVCDILQQSEKPSWLNFLAMASPVAAPCLPAASLTYAKLQEMTLRDVICFEGLLPGCSFPMETLSLQSFRQSLGDFYEAFVQNTNGTSFKCGLKVCEALLELDAWPLCVTIDSSASNHLASFSHGTLIDQMDWMVDLLEFQRRERPKQRDNSFVVTPKSVLFLTTSGVYDNRLLHVIDNSILYVQRGAVCVFFYTTNNHLNSEANQFCSHGLTSMTPVMSLLLRKGQQCILPAGKFFLLQASEPSTVVVSRFLCNLSMRRQLVAYRQLFADCYEDAFKWQFWKANWLAAMRFVRGLRAKTESLEESPRDQVTENDKLTIPFLVVALKIIHEIYGSGRNELQAFEALVAEKLGSPGPLGVLLELSTRCRDNAWKAGGHPLLHPDDMSPNSEDTTVFVDISPYPDSIDSNESIDRRVEDAQEEEWLFRCPCGIEQLNYDDGLAMVQCARCNAWSHIQCVGYDEEKGGDFVCPWCKEKRKEGHHKASKAKTTL